jgi:hypothetical protein
MYHTNVQDLESKYFGARQRNKTLVVFFVGTLSGASGKGGAGLPLLGSPAG